MTSPPALSVVVPCYNEEGNLEELYRRISTVCREVAGDDWELILVDDGSRDTTWPKIRELASQAHNLAGIRLSRNFGQQKALVAGLHFSRGDRVLVLDADLQDPPELLPSMMREMDQGADVVYGQSTARHGETFFKKMSAALFFKMLNRISDTGLTMEAGPVVLLSNQVVQSLRSMPEQHRFLRGMIGWVGFRQTPLEYERGQRHLGQTKYDYKKLWNLAVDAITSFSISPLRLGFVLGFIVGGAALLGLILALFGRIFGNGVPGFFWVLVAVLILGSVQLFVLGIMGEYLGRLYIESKQRPLYLVQEVVGREESRPATAVKGPPAENDAG